MTMMRSQNHRTNMNTANASVRKLRKVKPSERKSMAFLLVLLDPRAPLGPSRAQLRSGNKRRLDCTSHDHPPRGADFHHLRAGGEWSGLVSGRYQGYHLNIRGRRWHAAHWPSCRRRRAIRPRAKTSLSGDYLLVYRAITLEGRERRVHTRYAQSPKIGKA